MVSARVFLGVVPTSRETACDWEGVDMTMGSQNAVIISTGEGKSYSQLGRFYSFKLWSAQTNGLLSIVEISTPPGSGSPLHIHRNEDQTFYIVEGEFEIQCGDQRFTVTRGAITFLPRDIPHTYRNVGTAAGQRARGAPGRSYRDGDRAIPQSRRWSSPSALSSG